MGHKLAVEELGIDERVLPLADLSGIQLGDALRVKWPQADAIVGNPPYIGTKSMRSRMGDEYLEFLRDRFGVGVKDLCVYWFRKAAANLEPDGRAGLVATNSIREGGNRKASLDHVVETGGVIVDAVSSQPWSGAANVHVSIVNWVQQPSEPPTVFRLDGREVDGITSQLRVPAESIVAVALAGNRGKQFFGVVPSGDGFVLAEKEASRVLARSDADYGRVVRPYLVGDDITKRPGARPSRWIIDFGEHPLEEAVAWPAALEIVRKRVKPTRDTHRKKRERDEWWKFSRTVRDLFDAVADLRRFIACPATAKSFFMVWCDPDWCVGNAASAFAFEDDYAMGILSSGPHQRWAVDVSTKLETRPRYTTASFATFPWPQPTRAQRKGIADLARRLVARRSAICLERQIGLTKLYNEVEDGAYRDLAGLHRDLDEAVADAYGWPMSAAHDPLDSNRRLRELNRSIAAGETPYAPFA